MIRKIVSALFAAAVLFSACSRSNESLLTGAQEEAKTAYATKVVNNPEEADENSLLLFLEEDAVKTLAQGGADEALAALCAEVGVLRMERLFVSNNDLARSKGLHRWYVLTFETPQNPQLMAEKFAELPSVSHVQFNEGAATLDYIKLLVPDVLIAVFHALLAEGSVDEAVLVIEDAEGGVINDQAGSHDQD